jgi:hypothetical protein
MKALTLEDVQVGQLNGPRRSRLRMVSAEPRTQWLRDLIKLNDRGFIRTGRDVPGRTAAALPTPAVRDEPAERISRPATCGTAPSSASPGPPRGTSRSDPSLAIYAGLLLARHTASDETRLLQ